jgi:hypothetical protein
MKFAVLVDQLHTRTVCDPENRPTNLSPSGESPWALQDLSGFRWNIPAKQPPNETLTKLFADWPWLIVPES